jgi:hypothetical protein
MANHSLLPERPLLLSWWAVRLGSLVVSACLLVLLAILVSGTIESRTLASRTVLSPSGEKLGFRIHREHQDVMVSVKQITRGSGTGWSNTIWLGTMKSLGGGEASIDLEEDGDRVLLRAGERLVVFDLNSNDFDFPEGHSR